VSIRSSHLGPLGAVALVSGYVATLVSGQTIDLIAARRLLPRWDLAAHLAAGWTDAFYLETLQLPQLLWDLWLQGYWPPVPSLFQAPLYLVLGSHMTSGLQSSLVAFVLALLAGTALLCLQWTRAAWLPAALFVLFAVTSPFFLAYASVAMTEMLGVLAQLCVLVCHLRYEQHRSAAAARLFALSLTTLFFTKYNYFFLLAVPMLAHEYLRRTAAWGPAARVRHAWQWVRCWLGTPTGALLTAYLLGVLIVITTGGFALSVFGRRVTVTTIGNSGYVALYLLLGRMWFLDRRGRIDWQQLFSVDPRVRPLLLWFGVPVTVWLASPYPNHMKDVANLVVNTPLGAPSAATALVSYGAAIRVEYFADAWLLAATAVGFAVAALRFRAQPPLVQLLILTALMQFTMVLAHHTRFSRFLALPVSLVWLVSASELGTAVWRRSALLAAFAAPVVIGYALATAQTVVAGEPFRRLAFENYVDSPALHQALATLRADIGPVDRLAILGRSDALSPALFKWQLGPPAGETSFPLDIVRAVDVALIDTATCVLLIAPSHAELSSDEIRGDFPRHVARLQPWLDAGTFILTREIPVSDLQVTLRFYRLSASVALNGRRLHPRPDDGDAVARLHRVVEESLGGSPHDTGERDVERQFVDHQGKQARRRQLVGEDALWNRGRGHRRGVHELDGLNLLNHAVFAQLEVVGRQTTSRLPVRAGRHDIDDDQGRPIGSWAERMASRPTDRPCRRSV